MQNQNITNKCAACGSPLGRDEIAITKKMINRGTTTYYCKSCLADHFEITVADIDWLIERYKALGCTLFTDDEIDN